MKSKGVRLLEPESVKEFLAVQDWDGNMLHIAKCAYSKFTKLNNLVWTPPRIHKVRKVPFIPLEEELDQLISGTYTMMVAFLQLLKNTGIRKGEAWELEWTDIDFKASIVTLNDPEKNGVARQLKLEVKTLSMINNLPKLGEKTFTGSLAEFERTYRRNRAKLAKKLQNQRLRKISFHTFRHWKASSLYRQGWRLYDIMKFLGHRDIKTTMIYTRTASFKNEEYNVEVSTSLEKDKELLETGFEYVTDRDGVKFFRKRK